VELDTADGQRWFRERNEEGDDEGGESAFIECVGVTVTKAGLRALSFYVLVDSAVEYPY
jgi:hypothetical protein